MIYTAVQRLIEYGIRTSLITKDDEYVIRNGLMDLLGLTDWHDCELSEETAVIDDILAPIVEYACEQGIIPDTSSSRDLFDTKIMGILTPVPSVVRQIFQLTNYILTLRTDNNFSESFYFTGVGQSRPCELVSTSSNSKTILSVVSNCLGIFVISHNDLVIALLIQSIKPHFQPLHLRLTSKHIISDMIHINLIPNEQIPTLQIYTHRNDCVE